MIERFVARVGKVGAIAILAAAIVVIGVGGGAVEHFRLAANTEQGDQNGSHASSSGEGSAEAEDAGQSGNGQQTQGGNHASGARQQSGSTNNSSAGTLSQDAGY
jgi:hypothetical protein